MLLSLTAVRREPVGRRPAGSAGPSDRSRRPVAAMAVAAVAALGLAGGCSASERHAGAVLPVGSNESLTVVTLNLDEIEDCSTLAAAVIPLWDSLGDMTAEDANRLDSAVVTEIGTYLDGIERRRLAMGCSAEQWKLDTCAALDGNNNTIAAGFSDASC